MFTGKLEGKLKIKFNNIGWFEQWKAFDFVLEGGTLTKLLNHKILSVYDLRDSKCVDFEKFSGKKNTFAIFFPDGNTLTFLASTPLDKTRWMWQIENQNVKASLKLFEQNPDVACLALDKEGKIISLNETASSLFSVFTTDKKSLISKKLSSIVGEPTFFDNLSTSSKTAADVKIKNNKGETVHYGTFIEEMEDKQGYYVVFQPHKESITAEVIVKPLDPVNATDFTRTVIENNIFQFSKRFKKRLGDDLGDELKDLELQKKINKILMEEIDYFSSSLNTNFKELRTKMVAHVEKENLMKKEISELQQKFEQLENLSSDLKTPNKVPEKPLTPQVLPKFENVTLSDFKEFTTLGTGTFGRVKIVQHVITKEFYAMKILKKQKLINMRQVQHVTDEKLIQQRLNDCPFTVHCYKTFQTKTNLYMLLEYASGGELLTWISLYKKFREPMAQFFSAEIVLCLGDMHKQNIAYRDLKPENIILDSEGHIKIADFGFSKVVNDKTWTTCGTPEYLAPEVILGTGHDKVVDWYSLGILIFEMIAGYPPFHNEDRYKLFETVLKGNIPFPNYFSSTAKDLIKKLTHKDRNMRLGYLGVQEVQKHPFFKGINWDDLYNKRVKSPISIKLTEKGSTKYFMKYKESEDETPPTITSSEDDQFRDF